MYCFTSSAQNTSIIFLNNAFKKTSEGKAKYFQKIRWDDSTQTGCNTKIYRLDSSLLYEGGYADFNKQVYRDTTINYYKNGNKSSEYMYTNDFRLKVHNEFYSNGRLRYKRIYTVDSPAHVKLAYMFKKDPNAPNKLYYFAFYKQHGNKGIETRFHREDSVVKESVEFSINGNRKKRSKFTNYYTNGQIHYEKYYKPKSKKVGPRLARTMDSLISYYESGAIKRKEYYDKALKKNNVCYDLNGHEIPFVPFIKQAQYPGGQKALNSYLSKHIKYPKKARRRKKQGTTYVRFQVCTDGKLCNFEITKSIDPDMDKEVLKVLKNMPPWEPGTRDNKKVKTYFSLPVQFSLY